MQSEFELQFRTCSDSKKQDRVERAIALWGNNRRTLGQFPRGAFEDYANKQCIKYLLYGDTVAGYLLYRHARNRVAIAHLCVDEAIRGKGGAKFLFHDLKNSIDDGHCRGIEVRCRSDFEVNKMWPRLGFECVRNIPGRARSGSELTIWFYRFDVDDFFHDVTISQGSEERTCAVLDANIIFKLGAPSKAESLEALALTSGAVSNYARYFVTPEIFSEIERKKDRSEKARSLALARKYERLEVSRNSFESFMRILSPVWESVVLDRDRSDLQHIAYTAASGIRTFITQDEELLAKSERIYTLCEVEVVRPVKFITDLDRSDNSDKYNPRALARSRLHISCPRCEEITSIAQKFCLHMHGEKLKQLEAQIRTCVANHAAYKTTLITNDRDEYIALVCFKIERETLFIDKMRHCNDDISRTVVQNLLWHEIYSRNNHEISAIILSDVYSFSSNADLFCGPGFFRQGDSWIRLSSNFIDGLEGLKSKLITSLASISQIADTVRANLKTFISKKHVSSSLLEEVFWPAKVADTDIPTYLIPIQPVWALHLFDEGLASQDLWGADPSRHFNVENVYYRSATAIKMAPGSRLLWYVSSSGGSKKVSQIRACSRLVETDVGPAKDLYRKYKRLGIYEWENLMKMTGNDPKADIMALRFYQTEYFRSPIDLKDFPNYGIKGQPFSPKLVSNDQFIKIYRYGLQLNEK